MAIISSCLRIDKDLTLSTLDRNLLTNFNVHPNMEYKRSTPITSMDKLDILFENINNPKFNEYLTKVFK